MSKYNSGDILYQYIGIDLEDKKIYWEKYNILQVLEKVSESQYYLVSEDSKDYEIYEEGYFISHVDYDKVGAVIKYLNRESNIYIKSEIFELLDLLPESEREELRIKLTSRRIMKLEEEIILKKKDLVRSESYIKRLEEELDSLRGN